MLIAVSAASCAVGQYSIFRTGCICGCITTTDGKGRSILVVAAERSDAGHFIVEADQELPVFLELESAIKTHRHNHECDCPEPDEVSGDHCRESQ